MRNEWLEFILIGAGIGLAVLAIRALIGQDVPQVQLLALVLVGMALSLLQFRLALRRRRQGSRPPSEQNTARRPVTHVRPARPNPFDNELTRNWTGLDERLSNAEPPRAPDAAGKLVDSSTEPTDTLP
jgi:hypothetical protein